MKLVSWAMSLVDRHIHTVPDQSCANGGQPRVEEDVFGNTQCMGSILSSLFSFFAESVLRVLDV